MYIFYVKSCFINSFIFLNILKDLKNLPKDFKITKRPPPSIYVLESLLDLLVSYTTV